MSLVQTPKELEGGTRMNILQSRPCDAQDNPRSTHSANSSAGESTPTGEQPRL